MTRTKKLLIAVAALILLLAGGLVYLWTNLDWIVKSAIERFGTQALGVAVRVESVSLEPVKGKGAIRGLTVANPRGYSAPHIISLGGISVRIAPRTIAAETTVIEDIRITAPLIVYEMNDDRVANVDVLERKLGADKPAAGKKKGAKDKGKLLRIRHLLIENAKAEIRAAALGGKPRVVSLPRTEMKDIGGKNGAPPEEVATEIATAVLSQVGKEAGKAGAEKLLEKGLERALQRK